MKEEDDNGGPGSLRLRHVGCFHMWIIKETHQPVVFIPSCIFSNLAFLLPVNRNVSLQYSLSLLYMYLPSHCTGYRTQLGQQDRQYEYSILRKNRSCSFILPCIRYP